MKPFIKRPGNKIKYVKTICPLFPSSYKTYIEPFVGTGAIFLHTQPKKWIINDLNRQVFLSWSVIPDNSIQIIKKLKQYRKNTKDLDNSEMLLFAKNIRDKILKSKKETIELVILYLILINIIYKGTFNSSEKEMKFYSIDLNISRDGKVPRCFSNRYYENLRTISQYLNLNPGKILNEDYKKVLKLARKDDFVFLDPPYIEDHDYQFKYNNDEKLDGTFIVGLKKECKLLDGKKVKWLMTQADTMDIREAFKEYNISEYQVYRGMSNMYKTELIIKNY